MTRTAVFLFFIILGCARVHAQGVSNSAPASPIWTEIDFNPPGASLQVRLPASFTGHWVVGAKVVPGGKDQLKVSDGSFPFQVSPPLRPAGNQIASLHPAPGPKLTPHSADQIEISGASIAITAAPPDQTLVLYLQLSRPRTLAILSSRSSDLSVPVTTSVVISDGKVQSTSLFGDVDLITMTATGNPAESSPAIIERQGSYYVRNISFLRSHLETNAVEFGKAASGVGPPSFFVSVTVGPLGDVRGAKCPASVATDDCNIIRSTVQQWHFQPFLVAGKAVPVIAQVPIMIMPTGDIASALSPGAEVH